MGLFQKFNISKPPPETIQVQLSDIGESLTLFIQDAGRNNIAAPDAILNALNVVKSLLENGFKMETHKGQLFYALHHSLTVITDKIKACDEDAQSIVLDKQTLGLFKTSYCQLGEAALQFSGSAKIPEQLRYLFSNNGYGHGAEEKKYKGQFLNDMARNTLPAFFSKYPVDDASHEELDFYDAPAPRQRLM